jgi:hypothetical protein
MKKLLQFSLWGGLVLAALIGWHLRPRPQPQPAVPRRIRMDVSPPEAGRYKRPDHPSPKKTAPATPWSAVEAKTRAQFILNLRELGCPEQTIRDLVTLEVCRHYHRRLLDSEMAALRSWDYTRNRNPRDGQELLKQQRELRNAMFSELESLLGVGAAKLTAKVLGQPTFEDDTEFIPLDKQGPLRDLKLRYLQLTEEARQGLLPWESEAMVDARIHALNRQQQAELARLLTPRELEALNLRESPAAQYVLNHLPEANSEEEFRKMVKVAEEIGISAPEMEDPARRYDVPNGIGPSDEDRQLAEKRVRLEARLKGVLGDDRTAEQQRAETARQAEERQKEEAQREQRGRVQFAAKAEVAGFNADDANRFYDRIVDPALQTKLSDMEKSLIGTTAEKKQQMTAVMKAELEKIAAEIFGEKGPEFIQKLQ